MLSGKVHASPQLGHETVQHLSWEHWSVTTRKDHSSINEQVGSMEVAQTNSF